jgi:hypothetical protein
VVRTVQQDSNDVNGGGDVKMTLATTMMLWSELWLLIFSSGQINVQHIWIIVTVLINPKSEVWNFKHIEV